MSNLYLRGGPKEVEYIGVATQTDVIRAGKKSMNVTFIGDVTPDIRKTQVLFLEQALNGKAFANGECVTVDNRALRLDVGVAVFIDLTTSQCGFSHSLPGILLGIFMEMSRKQRPKLHWYLRYKGDVLPNPTYPFPCKMPWAFAAKQN